MVLLVGLRNERDGCDGYCSESIRTYNELLTLKPPPLQASVKKDQPLPSLESQILHLLVFWAHVGRMPLSTFGHYNILCELPSGDGVTDELIEAHLILIAIDWTQEWDERYHGIYIARENGLAHRIGMPIEPLTRGKWLAANPEKELIFLV
jgi:hypothetical protein